MQLTVTPWHDGGLEFVSELCHEEPRESVRLLEGTPSSVGLVTMCSWGKQMRSGAGWLEVEVAGAELGLFDATALPGLSHGICPDCAARL